MTKPEFNALLPFKVEDLVSYIIENEKLTFNDAVDKLYQSELNNCLSSEETKLWHLSTAKLYEMLEEEKITGHFKYPDFV
jgi:hypothetical protein